MAEIADLQRRCAANNARIEANAAILQRNAAAIEEARRRHSNSRVKRGRGLTPSQVELDYAEYKKKRRRVKPPASVEEMHRFAAERGDADGKLRIEAFAQFRVKTLVQHNKLQDLMLVDGSLPREVRDKLASVPCTERALELAELHQVPLNALKLANPSASCIEASHVYSYIPKFEKYFVDMGRRRAGGKGGAKRAQREAQRLERNAVGL